MIAFRSFLYMIWLFGGSAVIAIAATPLLIMPRRYTAGLMRLWGRFVCLGLKVICNVRVEVRGTPPTGPALIAAKHQSMLDIPGPFTFLPDACFVMKQELLRIPYFGWYAVKVRMIWLDRGGHSAALRKLVADTQDRMQHDRQVVIFPEGTRTPPGQAGQYQPGIAALYRDLGLPCIPCATNSGAHWQGKGGFMRWPGTVVFEYLEPIPAGLKRGEFMKLLEERVETASNALLAEGL